MEGNYPLILFITLIFFACSFYMLTTIRKKVREHLSYGFIFIMPSFFTMYSILMQKEEKNKAAIIVFLIFFLCMGLNLIVRGLYLWAKENKEERYHEKNLT